MFYKSRKFDDCLKMRMDGLVDFGSSGASNRICGRRRRANHVGTPSVYNENENVRENTAKQKDGGIYARDIGAHSRKVHDQLDARNASARWFQISLILDPMLSTVKGVKRTPRR